MEAEEIYVNMEDLGVTRGRTEHRGPGKTETKAVRTRPAAGEETETWAPRRVATVCLGLLSFLLLTTVIGVVVLYGRDLANHTAEKHQLLVRYQNLSDERDQLRSSLNRTTLELDRVMRSMEICPHGWRKFSCKCYFLSAARNTWDTSRQQCRSLGADLVIISRPQEMEFLNELGAHLKVWIGFSQSHVGGPWTWISGRPAGTTYWQRGQPSPGYRRHCAAFNSFQTGTFYWTFQSWSSESCDLHRHWVCEKKAVPAVG